MTHVISLLVENHHGVLARIAGLFSGRGYNLESITAGPTTDPTVTRITLVCRGDDQVITQIKEQLNKLIDIIGIVDLAGRKAIHRELSLIKIAAAPGKRADIFQISGVFGAKIMDVGLDSVVVELTGSGEKIDDFVSLLGRDAVIEMARSGLVSLERGEKTRTDEDDPEAGVQADAARLNGHTLRGVALKAAELDNTSHNKD